MRSPFPTWTLPYAPCTSAASAAITTIAASEVPVASARIQARGSAAAPRSSRPRLRTGPERAGGGRDGGQPEERDIARHTTACPLHSRGSRRASPLTADPARAAVFCDIDGTLAPIVKRAEEAHVREETSLLLGRLARRYGCVACVSGRRRRRRAGSSASASIAYVGSHGAELLEPAHHARASRPSPAGRAGCALRPPSATRPSCAAAHADRGQGPDQRLPLARRARRGRGRDAAGGARRRRPRPPGWPPTGGARCSRSDRRSRWTRARACGPDRATGVRAALYGGDDVTDLDAFDALDALVDEGRSTPPCAWACARTKVRPRSSSAPTSWSTASRASPRVLADLAAA